MVDLEYMQKCWNKVNLPQCEVAIVGGGGEGGNSNWEFLSNGHESSSTTHKTQWQPHIEVG